VVRAKGEAQPFLDKAAWEKVKRSGDASIERWIDTQLSGTSVTVVLVGAETYGRRWVRYEVKRSYERGNGIFGIFIHNIKDPLSGVDQQGRNPLDYWHIKTGGREVSFAAIYPTYDWVYDDGYTNQYLFTGDLTSRGNRERNRGRERGGRGEVGLGESAGAAREGSG
jgi:hypothetical protein